MRRYCLISLVLMTAISAGCGPVHNEQPLAIPSNLSLQRLAVEFSGKKSFEVLHARAKSTNVGALVPVLGDLVEKGIRSSSDDKLETDIGARLEKRDCLGEFRQSFLEAAARNPRAKKIEILEEGAGGGSNADGTLHFEIRSCGFRLIDKVHDTMSAYVDVEIRLVDNTSKQVLWDDRETILGDHRISLEALRADPRQAASEFESALYQAGTRLAYKVFYY